ncbi:MAG: response regulator [Chloroflexi bacterium]|nr:response regulator [Chloroflexota bacterium]
MSAAVGRFLVVDDSRINRMKLQLALEGDGHAVALAEDGAQALERLAAEPFDVVLLDIEMPVLDGYEVLARMKADPALRDVPVIVISAIDEMGSVVRCIEMGATDYLPKPFDAALLRARIIASLASKRLRDLEREYLEQVGHVIAGADAVVAGTFSPVDLDPVAARDDALGTLARVFQQMAREVRAREDRLRREVAELRIEIDHGRQNRRVAEITESSYFRTLRGQADGLRRIIDEGQESERG